MKGSWPRVEASLQFSFRAWHSLPCIGKADRHKHIYYARAGWHQEISPVTGCTKSLREMDKDLEGIREQLASADLNKLLPMPPTAEVLACWILAQLPAYWTFVEVEAYGCFRVRITGADLRAEWQAKFGPKIP